MNEPTFNMAKVVIPFEADTSQVDAALDRLEQRAKAIRLSVEGRVEADEPVRTVERRETAPAPEQAAAQSDQREVLTDIRDTLRQIMERLAQIQEQMPDGNQL